MAHMHLKPFIAEFVGTFFLAFAVWVSIAFVIPVSTAVIAGLTLGLFVYTVGPISGAHLNPAVTIGLLSAKKISFPDAMGYIVAQLVGAIVVLVVVSNIHGMVPMPSADNSLRVAAAEAFGAGILAFGVCSAVMKKIHANVSGLVVGGSLLLGVLCAGPFSNAVLNPAVAFAIGSFSPAYVVGPLIGGIVGVWLCVFLYE